MFDNNLGSVEEKVIKFSKWLRIYYIFQMVIIGVSLVLMMIALSVGSRGGGQTETFWGRFTVMFFLLIIFFALSIFFFIYYGKVYRQTEDYSYISKTPALINLVIIAIALLLDIGGLFSANIIAIIRFIITLFVAYLAFNVYSGLCTIDDEQLFG